MDGLNLIGGDIFCLELPVPALHIADGMSPLIGEPAPTAGSTATNLSPDNVGAQEAREGIVEDLTKTRESGAFFGAQRHGGLLMNLTVHDDKGCVTL